MNIVVHPPMQFGAALKKIQSASSDVMSLMFFLPAIVPFVAAKHKHIIEQSFEFGFGVL